MSIPATIVDKLRNYEYEKCGCEGAVGDIYALIHHIAVLEEEIDDLKYRNRPHAGGGEMDKVTCASEGHRLPV